MMMMMMMMMMMFQVADPESESYWRNRADLAFKYCVAIYCVILNSLSRIFDKDGDGFVSKKEFKWMTANKRINMRKVNIMFEVCAPFIVDPASVIIMLRVCLSICQNCQEASEYP